MTTTNTQTRTFAEIEASIEACIQTINESWRQMAKDFRDIRDDASVEMQGINRNSPKYKPTLKKLTGYETLDEYWPRRWKRSKRSVNQMIKSAEIAEEVGDGASGKAFPEDNEWTFHQMHGIPKQKRKKVFEQARAKAAKEGVRVNSRHTKEAAEQHKRRSKAAKPKAKPLGQTLDEFDIDAANSIWALLKQYGRYHHPEVLFKHLEQAVELAKSQTWVFETDPSCPFNNNKK